MPTNNDLIYQLNIDPRKINGKNILITGGTGSFGQMMTKTLLEHFTPNRIIIFSRDEYKQSLIKAKFPTKDYPCLRYFLGDIRDLQRLTTAMSGVNIVFHTAALKRIQECEYNPMEAVKTNILGTENVIQAAIDNKVEYVLSLSTDKACSPVNLYGATKLTAEKLVLNGNITSKKQTKCCVLRYGNQFGSRGSLVEIFKRLRQQNQPLTVTATEMTRFTILLQEAVHFVLQCLDKMIGGEIFIPKLPSYSVEQMLRCFDATNPETDYQIIGVRPGEKYHELMISSDESHQAYEFEDFYVIAPLEEHELQFFDIKEYPESTYQKCHLAKPYSSGDNELITDERLRHLIDQIPFF